MESGRQLTENDSLEEQYQERQQKMREEDPKKKEQEKAHKAWLLGLVDKEIECSWITILAIGFYLMSGLQSRALILESDSSVTDADPLESAMIAGILIIYTDWIFMNNAFLRAEDIERTNREDVRSFLDAEMLAEGFLLSLVANLLKIYSILDRHNALQEKKPAEKAEEDEVPLIL